MQRPPSHCAAKGVGGSVNRQVTVVVEPAPVPVADGGTGAPVREAVDVNGMTTLTWKSEGVDSCTAFGRLERAQSNR